MFAVYVTDQVIKEWTVKKQHSWMEPKLKNASAVDNHVTRQRSVSHDTISTATRYAQMTKKRIILKRTTTTGAMNSTIMMNMMMTLDRKTTKKILDMQECTWEYAKWILDIITMKMESGVDKKCQPTGADDTLHHWMCHGLGHQMFHLYQECRQLERVRLNGNNSWRISRMKNQTPAQMNMRMNPQLIPIKNV